MVQQSPAQDDTNEILPMLNILHNHYRGERELQSCSNRLWMLDRHAF